MKRVSIQTAEKGFMKLIQEIERTGESYVITRHGRPVARLAPHQRDKRTDPNWQEAFAEMQRLHADGLDLGGMRLDREEIYRRR